MSSVPAIATLALQPSVVHYFGCRGVPLVGSPCSRGEPCDRRELADWQRPNPYAAAAASSECTASDSAAAASSDRAAPATVGAAAAAVPGAATPSTAAAVSTTPVSASASTSRKPDAGKSRAFLIKNIESRQADVGHFLLGEDY